MLAAILAGIGIVLLLSLAEGMMLLAYGKEGVQKRKAEKKYDAGKYGNLLVLGLAFMMIPITVASPDWWYGVLTFIFIAIGYVLWIVYRRKQMKRYFADQEMKEKSKQQTHNTKFYGGEP